MDITVKIEGLDQLTEAIALVGSALASTKGMVKTQEALDDIAQESQKAQDWVAEPVEKVEKSQEPTSQPQGVVPTGQAAYSFEQIQLACAKVAQAGKRAELQGLINGFGLNSLLELKEGQYNDFVLKLREIGGTI